MRAIWTAEQCSRGRALAAPCRRLAAAVALLALAVAGPQAALAQQQQQQQQQEQQPRPPFASPPATIPADSGSGTDGQPRLEVPSPILTVDQQRLFTESAFGRRVSAQIEARSKVLGAENRRMEAQLKAEEEQLTRERGTLPDAEFRKKANAFDAKVQRIRAEQDRKVSDLTAFRDAEQKRFGTGLGQVLAAIAKRHGAVAVMDRRAMLVSANSIDITDEAVKAVDAQLGDGTPVPADEPGHELDTAGKTGTTAGTPGASGGDASGAPAPETSPAAPGDGAGSGSAVTGAPPAPGGDQPLLDEPKTPSGGGFPLGGSTGATPAKPSSGGGASGVMP